MTGMTADELGSRIPLGAIRWLRPACVLAYVAAALAILLGTVLDSRPVLVAACVLLVVGLCSMVACCVTMRSRPS